MRSLVAEQVLVLDSSLDTRFAGRKKERKGGMGIKVTVTIWAFPGVRVVDTATPKEET